MRPHLRHERLGLGDGGEEGGLQRLELALHHRHLLLRELQLLQAHLRARVHVSRARGKRARQC